jgi:hypothetical protein
MYWKNPAGLDRGNSLRDRAEMVNSANRLPHHSTKYTSTRLEDNIPPQKVIKKSVIELSMDSTSWNAIANPMWMPILVQDLDIPGDGMDPESGPLVSLYTGG